LEHGKGKKVKFALKQAVKAKRERRGIVLFFLSPRLYKEVND
jgi:hypothetical protein